MLAFNEGERVMISSLTGRTGGVKAFPKLYSPQLEQILENHDDLAQTCPMSH